MREIYEYKARVRSVYDGDTFRADVDLGFDVWLNDIAFRLNRINTPELSSTSLSGRESRDYLRLLMPIGSEIIVRTEKDKEEKYGRMLADAYVFDGFAGSVNDRLVDAGFAKYWDGHGDRPV